MAVIVDLLDTVSLGVLHLCTYTGSLVYSMDRLPDWAEGAQHTLSWPIVCVPMLRSLYLPHTSLREALP